MKWLKIPEQTFSSEKEIQLLKLSGTKFCLIHHQGHWYATATRCPHAGANLAYGWCEKGEIICPYHRHRFNLINGKGAEGQNNYIRTYRLQQREDGIYIELPQSLFRKILDFFKLL